MIRMRGARELMLSFFVIAVGLGGMQPRPAGAEALSIVDYLYLGQLVSLLFSPATQQEARARLGGGGVIFGTFPSAVSNLAQTRRWQRA